MKQVKEYLNRFKDINNMVNLEENEVAKEIESLYSINKKIAKGCLNLLDYQGQIEIRDTRIIVKELI